MKTRRPPKTAKFTGKVVYLAGAYSRGGKASPCERIDNLKIMDICGIILWKFGAAVIHPVRNTYLDDLEHVIGYEAIIAGDLLLLAKCDMVVMCPNWANSTGARREHAYALEHKKPVYYMTSEGKVT